MYMDHSLNFIHMQIINMIKKYRTCDYDEFYYARDETEYCLDFEFFLFFLEFLIHLFSFTSHSLLYFHLFS